MKIAIPTIDTEENCHILADGLNTNGSLYIFDLAKQSGEYIKTIDLATNLGDLLPALEAKGAMVIITKQIHPMALKVLVNKGFRVCQAIGTNTEDNLQHYQDGMLGLFTYYDAMEYATTCSGACTACNTSSCDDKKYIDA